MRFLPMHASHRSAAGLTRFRRVGPALPLLAAFTLCGFFLSACSGGGLVGDLASGRLIEGQEDATVEVSAATTAVGVEGGKIKVDISNSGEGEMRWSASLDANWASIQGESDGNGSATVSIAFEANAQPQERTATLSISSADASNSPRTVVFTQTAAEPQPVPGLEVSADAYALGAEGGKALATVVNSGGGELEWSASLSSNAPWVRFVGKSAGRGEGTIEIEVDANSTGQVRSFELTVRAEGADQSPQTLHFSQKSSEEAAAEDAIDISADNYEFPADGATLQVAVTAGEEVRWTAQVDAESAWAHIVGPSSGVGNGTIALRTGHNDEQQVRSVELTVTADGADQPPQTLHFTQDAAVPALLLVTVESGSHSVPHTGGTVRVRVANGGGGQLLWNATTDASWATIEGSNSGTNSGSLVIAIGENTGQERSFTVTVQAEGTENSAGSVTITQSGTPEQPQTSVRVRSNKYAVSHEDEILTISIDTQGNQELQWTVDAPQAETTYIEVVTAEETGEETEVERERGEWVRILGANSGVGPGSVQVQVDANPIPVRWSFSVTIRFPDATELDQTLHFGQDRGALPQLILTTVSRHIGAGGESVDVQLTSPAGQDVYWSVEVDVDWAHLGGELNSSLDGNGDATIRIAVDPNPGAERSFTLSVSAKDVNSPAPLVFRQAPAEVRTEGDPVPPPPPDWYGNDCQRQTQGFEEFGGWLARNGHYRNTTDSRIWRHTSEENSSNAGTLRAFTDCTDGRRTLTTEILADDMLDEPLEFADLPVDDDVRIVLLDTLPPTVGEHLAGARHEDPAYVWSDEGSGWYPTYTRDGSGAKFLHVQPLGDWGYGSSSGWQSQLSQWNTNGSDMSDWTAIARGYGWRLPSIQERTGEGLRMLAGSGSSLWLLVGGYEGSGTNRRIHPNSAVCGEAMELCLFAPWSYRYTDDEGVAQTAEGTAVAAAQVAAALDNVLLLWPDYELLELRNLVLDCAEDMGQEGPDEMWGRGVLSFNCLFSPNSELRDPRTGATLSGGIHGPLAGLHGGAESAPFPAGAFITGADHSGRDFAYPLMRWSYRQNHALLAATGLSSGAEPNSPWMFGSFRQEGRSAQIPASGGFSTHIAASGDAVGAAALWRGGGVLNTTGLWTFRGGLALQQEGAGSLTGSGVFRAPSTLSSAFSVAYQRSFTPQLSLHLRGQYWMTLDSGPRSLWSGAQLSELRASASLSYRLGRARTALEVQYGGGLHGRLDVAEQSINLTRQSARQLSLRVGIPFGTQQRRESPMPRGPALAR